MAYRCQSCGHFAGLDEPELYENNSSYDGETIEVSVSASYPSSCCGDEVAIAEYECSDTFSLEHKPDCEEPESGYTFSISLEMNGTDRYQDKDRHGKPIKNMRYQRHYYGVEVEATVTCDTCGADDSVSLSDESGPPEEVY